jgi:dTDP-4-amino-4,6-dideoxygalactose transaminase
MPFADHLGDNAYHLMVAVAPDGEARAPAARSLKEAGIQTSLHYPCIADFTAQGRHRSAAVARSRAFAARALTLPLFPTMTAAQVGDVASVLAAAAEGSLAQA